MLQAQTIFRDIPVFLRFRLIYLNVYFLNFHVFTVFDFFKYIYNSFLNKCDGVSLNVYIEVGRH